jgi:membrane-bound metal-dependent hydrolase YbcI (DUF457 family)
MDNLTHTLSGVVLARAGLSQRFGKGTTLVLAVASNLPDIDVFWTFAGLGDPVFSRRLLTHSVLGVPLLAAAAAFLFRLRYKHISWNALFGLCLLGMVVHVFMDLWNSYGVVALYPFSMLRFELAWVFIIDLVVWALLLAPLLLSRVRSKATELMKLSRVALVGLGLYVAACAMGRVRAERVLDRIASEQNPAPIFSYAFPEVLGPHRFRGVVRHGGEYRFYLIDVLGGRAELKDTVPTDEAAPAVRLARATEEGRRVEWFFKATVWRVVAAQQTTSPNSVADSAAEVEAFDLRFRSLVFERRGSFFAYRFLVRDGQAQALGWKD